MKLTQGADEPVVIIIRQFIRSYSVPYYTKKDITIILIVDTEFERYPVQTILEAEEEGAGWAQRGSASAGGGAGGLFECAARPA